MKDRAFVKGYCIICDKKFHWWSKKLSIPFPYLETIHLGCRKEFTRRTGKELDVK